MLCKNCGKDMGSNTNFCIECGAKILPEEPPKPVEAFVPPVQPPSQQQQPPQQQYQQQQQPPQQHHYTSPYTTTYKKKKHIGRWVLISIIVLLVASVLFLYGSMAWFPPKDLGVKYTQADYNRVVKKLGIHVTANLGKGEKYDNAAIVAGSTTSKGKSSISSATSKKGLSFKDYNWKFSKYKHKKITLTAAEATAFFNDIAPEFWWFKNTQVQIAKDGKIITSSSADVKKIIEELYSDVAGQIPLPLPDKVNLYTEGDFSITNNKISMTPDVFNAGVIPIPKQYISGSNLDTFSNYLDRFYTVIPNLQINFAGVKNGEFVFDGIIPTEVSITPKK